MCVSSTQILFRIKAQGDRHQVAQALERLWKPVGKLPKQGNLRTLFNRDKTEVLLALPRYLVSTKRLANLPAATDDQLASIVAIAAEAELPLSHRRSDLYLPRCAPNLGYDFGRVDIYPAVVCHRLSRSP